MSYRKHLMTSDEPPSELYKAAEVGTNLASLGTDCISRQAAIDEIDEWIKAFRENGHKESAADACLIQDGIIHLPPAHPDIPDDARDAFMNLVYDELHSDGDNNRANRIIDAADEYVEYSLAKPSAQPEPCEDAVSRKTILKFLDDWMSALEDNVHNQSASDLKIIKKDFENLPSAEPQIIRCKDCKHWIPYDWMFREVWQSKNIADYPEDEIGCSLCDMAMKADDFCSRAERREVTT